MKSYRRRGLGRSQLGKYDWWRCPKHPGYMQPSGLCAQCREEAEAQAAAATTRAEVERDLREWEANEIDLPENERFSR